MGKQRGFTVLEVSIAAGIFAVLLGAAVSAFSGDGRVERELTKSVGPEMRARHALDRIVSDLRMASILGEDLNGNGNLDDNEDLNDNGLLDSNWNLIDGAVDAPRLQFNRRIDLRDTDGEMVAVGVFSRIVAFYVEGDRLIRYWEATDFDNGKTVRNRTVLAAPIAGVRFSRTGGVIRVSIDYLVKSAGGKTTRGTVTSSVALRN
jgi:prepilin-type N-terminal cleavage/methylation domain-containing protein